MFTGLIEEVGILRRIERGTDGARLVIGARTVLEDTRLGDSIAVSGACLTVTALGVDEFVADCMPETLARTTLGGMARGAEVNLERSLVLGSRLGGHLVLGHVDAVAEVKAIDKKGDSLEVRFDLPSEVAPFLVAKGSVALDGASLTVISVSEREFVVGLIPHTIGATSLRALARGSRVNIEADVLARYVQRSLMMGAAVDSGTGESVDLSMELLAEKGFV